MYGLLMTNVPLSRCGFRLQSPPSPSLIVSFSTEHRCFYWEDILLSASVMDVVGGPLLLLCFRLLKTHDAFRIGEELVRVIGGCCLCQSESKQHDS